MESPESFQCFADDSTCDTTTTTRSPSWTPGRRAAGGHAGRPAARLPLGRRHAAVRADPVPGGRGRSPATSTTPLGLRLLLGRGPAHDLRLRPRGLPLHAERPGNPCIARPATARRRRRTRSRASTTNDELVFMADDAGPQAPRTAPLPPASRRRAGGPDRPARPGPAQKFVYVMKARADGPRPRSTRPTATCTTSATRTPTSSRSPSRATRATGTRAAGVVLQRRRRGRRATDERQRPARLRDGHDRPLPVPLRRPLADDQPPASRPTAARATART